MSPPLSQHPTLTDQGHIQGPPYELGGKISGPNIWPKTSKCDFG